MSTVTMYKLFVLSLVLAVAAGQMTQAMRDRILSDHNTKRRQATNAANMIELRYDTVLEQVAQAYLNRGCGGGFQHNPNRGCDYTARGGRNGGSGSCASVGENWYSGYTDNSQGVDVVIGGAVAQWTDGRCSSWASPPMRCNSYMCSEKQNFYQSGSDSYGSCTQTSGQVLHYTQVMWATTTHVGCGYTAQCGTLCNYAMSGNMNLPSFGSMREANVWKIGTPCSACPSGYGICNSGLCSAGGSTATTAAPVTSCAADTTNKPTNGGVGSCGTRTNVGYSCTQTCNTGYTVTSGSLTRNCQSGGVWSATNAVCSLRTCPADSSTKPTNGNAGTCASSKTYGQTCQMACNSGYYLSSGSLTRTCGSTGTFSSASAVCSATYTPTNPPTYPPTYPPTSPPSGGSGSYCTSGPRNVEDSEIGAVTLIGNGNRISDSTGCPGSVGPTDLTYLSTTLTQGQSYTLTFDRTTCGEWYLAIAGAWIDWNQNKDWETSEQLFPFSQKIGTNTFSFTVPSWAKPGTTRMRLQVQEIGSSSTTTIDPCASFGWGDTKDYSIVITGAYAALEASDRIAVAADVCQPDGVAPINGGLGTCSEPSIAGVSCTQTCDAGFQLRPGTSLDRECTALGYANSTAICE